MQVAIKTIKKAKIETEADLIRIRREIQIMSSVRHPNIIHIYEVFENKEKMVLVMEYAAGGELYDYLSQRKVLSETEARRVFRQVASAVYYCHKVYFFLRKLSVKTDARIRIRLIISIRIRQINPDPVGSGPDTPYW